MRHQLAQGDRLRIGPCAAYAEPGQGILHRRVQIEPTLGDKLHGCGIGEQLAELADPVTGVDSRRYFGLYVSPAETSRPNDFLIVDQRNAQTR